MKRIEKALDEMDVKYDYEQDTDGWYGLVEFWTDTAGQDIPTEFTFDGSAYDFVEKFTEAAERYDVDNEVEQYVNIRGKNGVPDTVRELLDDYQEAKDTLMEIAEALKKAIGCS